MPMKTSTFFRIFCERSGDLRAWVQYPFGYGLSYTEFTYSDLKIDETGIRLLVTNTGDRDGAEVVQMYVSLPNAIVFRPAKELKGYLEIIMVVSSIMLIRSKTEENLQKKYDLWNYLKENDKRTYYWMKWSILGRSMNLPGRSGRKISEMAYYLAQKFVGFN